MVTDGSVRVERVGRAAQAKIVQASIPSAVFSVSPVSPDSETAALQCGRPVSVHGSMLTPTPTWTPGATIARRDSTDSTGAFWACLAITPSLLPGAKLRFGDRRSI